MYITKMTGFPFLPFIKTFVWNIAPKCDTHVADSQKACNVYGMVLQFINCFIPALVYS